MKAFEEPITYETLRSLAEIRSDPVVSVFHPTLRATFHEEQNYDRLKILLARSEPLLAARGLKRDEIDRLLHRARRLIHHEEFWSHRLDGLAIFIAHDLVRYYRIPFAVPELAGVSDAPNIRPLLPAAATEGPFYVLAMSRNLVRMFRATRSRFEEIDLVSAGAPSSLSDALRYDDFSRQMQSHTTGRADVRLQTHSQAAARAGRHAWHGHGGGGEQLKEQLGRFFGAIDERVCKLLTAERAPLILAAVDYEQDLYRRTTKYPNVVAEGIDGNPDRTTLKELHMTAWPIARSALDAPVHAATVTYLEASSAGDASDDLAEILRAVHEGRVSALLLREGAEEWGTYHPQTSRVETHGVAQSLDTDLLDLAARQSLLHGGDAYVVGSERMPCEGSIAALYRY
jgi:hypothetical protein